MKTKRALEFGQKLTRGAVGYRPEFIDDTYPAHVSDNEIKTIYHYLITFAWLCALSFALAVIMINW
jgi:hypothetical protein